MSSGRWLVTAWLCACLATLSSTVGAQSTADLPGILVSRQLMAAERLRVGDVVALGAGAAGADRPFRIVGEYEPTPDPLQLGAPRLEVRLHLPDLIDLTAEPSDPVAADAVDALNVGLADGARHRDASERMVRQIPGILVQATSVDDRRAAPFVVLERFHVAIAVITVVASSVFLLALMLMLVEERRATVGVLRLIGFRRVRIVQHVLAEGVALAVLGALFGVVLSVLMQGAINQFFQWRYDTTLVFVRITPAVALQAVAVSVPLGIAAVLASSWSLLRDSRLSPGRR